MRVPRSNSTKLDAIDNRLPLTIDYTFANLSFPFPPQVVTLCILSVLVSIMAKGEKEVNIPCANGDIYQKYLDDNITCGQPFYGNVSDFQNTSHFYLKGEYTGLNIDTLRKNLYS